jgi:hypothetical protein
MESAIDAISERLASSNVDKLEREAAALTRQRLDILQQLRETRIKLVEARSSEYRGIVLAGETYSPSEAARYIAKNREMARWIPGPVTPGVPLPLSTSELLELYHSNATISSKDERELYLFLPESGNLLSPFDFERIIIEQTQLMKEHLEFRRDLWFEGTQYNSPEAIQDLQKYLIQGMELLRDLVGWRLAAIVAGREGGGRRQAWDDLIKEVEGVYNYAAQMQPQILRYGPYIPQNCLPGRIEKVLDEIIEYLSNGRKLSSFKLLMKRDWKALIECTRVKGKQPEELEHFQALKGVLHLWIARADLVGRWQRQMAILDGPNAFTLGPEPERTFHHFVDPLRRCLDWYINTWFPLERELKRQGFQWDAFLSETQVVHDEYGDILRLRAAVVERLPHVITAEFYRRVYARNEAKIAGTEHNLKQIGNNPIRAEVVQTLNDAVKERNIQAYHIAYELDFVHVLRGSSECVHFQLTNRQPKTVAQE